jgi:hypothetical protein
MMTRLIPQVRHTYRFSSVTSVNFAITPDTLLAAMGNCCDVVNSTVISMFSTCKIHRIRAWAAVAPSSGQPATVTLNWASGSFNNAANTSVSDTSTSYERPAFIDAKPPSGTIASFWVSPNTGTLCNIFSNVPIVMDVDVTGSTTSGETGIATAVSTAILGTYFWLALDGPGNNNMVPVGLLTTH